VIESAQTRELALAAMQVRLCSLYRKGCCTYAPAAEFSPGGLNVERVVPVQRDQENIAYPELASLRPCAQSQVLQPLDRADGYYDDSLGTMRFRGLVWSYRLYG
jgi:hypothetical protein